MSLGASVTKARQAPPWGEVTGLMHLMQAVQLSESFLGTGTQFTRHTLPPLSLATKSLAATYNTPNSRFSHPSWGPWVHCFFFSFAFSSLRKMQQVTVLNT